MEVQAHGNYYENLKIKELTGFSKEEYAKRHHSGYLGRRARGEV